MTVSPAPARVPTMIGAPAAVDPRPLKFVVTGRDENKLGVLTRLVTAEWFHNGDDVCSHGFSAADSGAAADIAAAMTITPGRPPPLGATRRTILPAASQRPPLLFDGEKSTADVVAEHVPVAAAPLITEAVVAPSGTRYEFAYA